ncbi:keratin-associated protein 20-2-like [Heterocephalus glaber]|uniref:Keratin-associated protein 20-2-like n=1 Tax=Heterocephalus glaber TaxID=10181 RepID=A0AAX6SSJ3_HETGA|nr:keratin-associated protein 20-2-like [Heterocephalus glaber]
MSFYGNYYDGLGCGYGGYGSYGSYGSYVSYGGYGYSCLRPLCCRRYCSFGFY